MRAYQLKGGFGLEHLAAVELEDPQPGPGQVRVAVRAVSLNYRDLMMVRGEYDPRQKLPLIPVSDGVGVIDAVGPGVTRVQVGRRVAGLFAQDWQSGEPTTARLRSTLGGPRDGMLAQYVVLPQSGVVEVPEYLQDAEAATLPCAAATAWSALVTQGRVKAGDVVLVQGTGGVASFALDFARLLGARVIATSSSPEKLEFLRQRGAWRVIDYVQEPRWGKKAREITQRRGVDHVVEVGGAGTLSESLRAVRPGGTISLIGVLAGGAADVNLTPALMNNVRIQGVFVGHRESYQDMIRALAAHEIRPVMDQTFGFDEAVQAFERLAAGRHRGKITISVS